jgi:hypothetical protein
VAPPPPPHPARRSAVSAAPVTARKRARNMMERVNRLSLLL